MFTVCPKCALTLVVTAADLRVAQGYVRCGRCLNVFNALARLSEERPSTAPGPAPAPIPEAPSEITAEAASEPAPEAASEPASELASVSASATSPDATARGSPEQPPPPQSSAPSSGIEDTGEIAFELDPSLLVTATRPPARQPAAAADTLPEEPQEAAAGSAEPPRDPVDLIAGEAAPQAQSEPAVPEEKAEASAAAPAPEEKAEAPAAAPVPGAQQTNSAQPPPASPFELQARRPRAGLAWTLGAGALAIALALQIVNHYRDALAADPALRGPLSTVYSALGVKLAPIWNIHAYDVRQLGASVAGTAAGEIVVRASVKNSASRAQPLPLLRVTLQDRFGNSIAARDVPPGDYLPSPDAAGSLLAAGSRVDATMIFVDPGPQAVGFEIDACLPQRDGAVACAHGP